MEKVSIILPTYKGEKYIHTSLASCLNQTYPNLEVVVVMDGPNDQTENILKRFNDPRIRIIRHEVNRGLPEGLNTGFRHATGDLLTWTSDDNYYAPTAIETLVDYLRAHPDVGLVCTPYYEIDPAGEIIRLYDPGPAEKIHEINTVGACFLYRRSVYEAVGDYNPKARYAEDYEYWLRTSAKFKIAKIDQPLYYYRLHASSLTSMDRMWFYRERLVAKMKREQFGLSWHRYWLKLAHLDIDEAFDSYQNKKYGRVPALVLRGLLRNPAWLLNRGVLSIFVRSLLAGKGA